LAFFFFLKIPKAAGRQSVKIITFEPEALESRSKAQKIWTRA